MIDFFDGQTIAECIFILCVILVIVITFYPRKKRYDTFGEWFQEVERLFAKEGFAVGYAQGLSMRMWESFYKKGLSPMESIEEYIDK